MKRKTKKSLRLRISMVAIAVAAGLAGYFLGFDQSHQENEKKPIEEERAIDRQGQTQAQKTDQAPIFAAEIKQSKPMGPQEYCAKMESDIKDFFRYLDKKNYVQHLNEGMDTYAEFKKIIKKLSSDLPIPAGEGIDSSMMTKNIFHIFRILSKSDIRLLKEITINESDTMEWNLEMFHRWLLLGSQCPDPDGVRPSFDELYQYAGFFLNTIGGRAYLSRRAMTVRMLLSYYSLLIVHEADRKGRNTYGIDVFPYIAPLSAEMAIQPDLKLKNEYIQNLHQMESYYLQKR